MRLAFAFALTLAAGSVSAQTGTYSIAGTDLDGTTEYGGQMTVAEQGDAFRVVWETGGEPVEGIGVLVGSILSVAYGGACGVVAYTPGEEGSFEGVWATMGGSDLGTEVAQPDGPDGTYRVAGTNPGSDAVYHGMLQMETVENASVLRWDVGGNVYEGIGLGLDDVSGAAYGAETCGVAVYRVLSDGTLEGVWTTLGARGVGTEIATPD